MVLFKSVRWRSYSVAAESLNVKNIRLI
jgi:hypothetical protein